MKKILSSIKLLIFLRFGRNIYQASIDRQKKMKAEKVIDRCFNIPASEKIYDRNRSTQHLTYMSKTRGGTIR